MLFFLWIRMMILNLQTVDSKITLVIKTIEKTKTDWLCTQFHSMLYLAPKYYTLKAITHQIRKSEKYWACQHFLGFLQVDKMFHLLTHWLTLSTYLCKIHLLVTSGIEKKAFTELPLKRKSNFTLGVTFKSFLLSKTLVIPRHQNIIKFLYRKQKYK